MKKTAIILSSVLALGLLAGCGSKDKNAEQKPANTETKVETPANSGAKDGTYADGTYFAQGKADEKTGWRYFVELKVSGGKITEAKWNATNSTVPVDKVTYSEQGKYGMKAGGAQAEWHEQAAKVEAYLVEKQDTKLELNNEGKTDAISGVSVHVNEFFTLADEALAAGPIQVGPYKDGNYHAEGDSFDPKSGWKETADIVIAAGKIVNVDFSGINEKGEDKKQNSIDGKYGMKAGGAQSEWHEQAAKAEEYIVEKQDPATLTFNDEGKTDAISGVSISLKSYYDLAAKALEQAK
jgi:major membrane immunogen (membrane-anchored lipoprotein)